MTNISLIPRFVQNDDAIEQEAETHLTDCEAFCPFEKATACADDGLVNLVRIIVAGDSKI